MRTGASFNVLENDFNTGTANCSPGEKATGGGVIPAAPNSNVYFPSVVASYPLPNPSTNTTTPGNGITPTGWQVWVADNDQKIGPAPTITMIPYVICASP
jgi:hypothetical protein